ncbi:hypothetical protein QE177_06470 [Arsenophonus sp. aPb]|uniref:hypothetical protein n=1 Tax=Arsenophonus sp. aPb TaxID=3041619 RepID=UPI00246970C6|nr:hypothetical protein [Arsenophonus sp. aPb]WGL99512.1 hypothetical protein QE177_06470 [Arsenophonus sp. aPb]
MIKSLFVLLKIFLLIALSLNFIVLVAFLFFEGLSYLSEGVFKLDILWLGLKGGVYGAIAASLIIWFFYHIIPTVKK